MLACSGSFDLTALPHTAVCVFVPVLVHNNGICMIHLVICTLYICIPRHTLVPHSHPRCCHVFICSALPWHHATAANHPVWMALLKAVWAACSKLAMLLKVFSQKTFATPPGSCHVKDKISQIWHNTKQINQPNTAWQHSFSKPVCAHNLCFNSKWCYYFQWSHRDTNEFRLLSMQY